MILDIGNIRKYKRNNWWCRHGDEKMISPGSLQLNLDGKESVRSYRSVLFCLFCWLVVSGISNSVSVLCV